MTSFYLKYLFKDQISKYSHIVRSWGLGLQHMNLVGGGRISADESLLPAAPVLSSGAPGGSGYPSLPISVNRKIPEQRILKKLL